MDYLDQLFSHDPVSRVVQKALLLFCLVDINILIQIKAAMELNFDDILAGKEAKHSEKTQKNKEVKLKQTETRARQQSCMISEIDKDLLPSNTKVKVENFRVSLSDMLHLDKNDESLESYKKTLLGDIKQENLKEDEPAEVQIIKIELICPDRPKGAIPLQFKNHDPKVVRKFTIKEGCIYCMRIHFIVRNDIVFGLKFVNNVYKMLAKVDKDQDKMGSFAPQEKPHHFDLPWTEAPQGFLARGDYKGKGLFLDNDGIVHCQFDYVMTIDSQW